MCVCVCVFACLRSPRRQQSMKQESKEQLTSRRIKTTSTSAQLMFMHDSVLPVILIKFYVMLCHLTDKLIMIYNEQHKVITLQPLFTDL